VLRVVRQANGGPGAAREAGRCAAQGEFIQYLDSDDLLLPRKFERQVAALRANPDCGVAYCAIHFRRPDGQEETGAWKGTGRDYDKMFPSFLNDRWWDTVTPLYRRTTCDQAGAWTTLRLEEDWEYDCRVAALGTRLAFLLARQCGAAGLAKESCRLFELARAAAGETRARGWDFRIYQGMATCIGWNSLGKLACWLDDLRAPRKPAPCP
jgi:glycosyltransferase involved in cell wall biosynthesis